MNNLRYTIDNQDKQLSSTQIQKSWVRDELVIACTSCKTKFGMFYRKHHCRCCGNIFCSNCVDKNSIIPLNLRIKEKDYWNPSHHVQMLQSEKKKVCTPCYEEIKQYLIDREKSMLSTIHYNAGIKNQTVKDQFYAALSNIQYKLPNEGYSSKELNILAANSEHFPQHSKYLTHLIRSLHWRDGDEEMILHLLNSERNMEHRDLLCTRTCRKQLSSDDIITILYNSANIPNAVIKYLFDILKSESSIVIQSYLLFFSLLIRTSPSEYIKKEIFNLIKDNDELKFYTYWYLHSYMAKRDTFNRNAVNESSNVKKFIKYFDLEETRAAYKSYEFFYGITLNKTAEDVKNYLDTHFEHNKSGLKYPFNTRINILSYETDIVVKDSKTKPIIITFNTDEGSKKIMFKKDCVYKDICVLNLMSLSDIVVGINLQIDMQTVIYGVLPLGMDAGMIEIVPDAVTVRSINGSTDLSSYVLSKNPNSTVSNLMEKYINSLVSYTLYSYLIGLGDRHLDNIMVKNDGSVFHIDFGYILGSDVHSMNSDIKLSADMIQLVGDRESPYCKDYLEKCKKGIVCLRKYHNMYFIILSCINGMSPESIEKFIKGRFKPSQNDNVVIDDLMRTIDRSKNSLGSRITDFLHHHSQEGTIGSLISSITGKY